MEIHKDFNRAIDYVRYNLINNSYSIKTEKWQGVELKWEMRETLNTSFSVAMDWPIEKLVADIKPNLPWADIHFTERVSSIPLNPGESYKSWPFYKMDKDMRNVEGKLFSHTYMERFWPKYANKSYMGDTELIKKHGIMATNGIRYKYGDLNDLVELLKREPYTRQAFLPIFFPEDTGAVHGGRIPCSIGYHFIRRNNLMHVVYYIRSCDYLRHFRDDIYLCVRLVDWILDKLTMGNSSWMKVRKGTYTMHITSLHIFENEYELVKRYNK